jgi:hypothetical protein
MCLACASVMKRPLLVWMERHGYLGYEASNLPTFAKPSIRQVNYWLDLLLETAMLMCVIHHPFMIGFLAAYYVLDYYAFNQQVSFALLEAKTKYFLLGGTPITVGSDAIAQGQPVDGELNLNNECEKGCGCDATSSMPGDYVVPDNDARPEAVAYHQLNTMAKNYSEYQTYYTLTNATWTLSLLTATLLFAPGASVIIPAALNLLRFPLTYALYTKQTKIVAESFVEDSHAEKAEVEPDTCFSPGMQAAH